MAKEDLIPFTERTEEEAKEMSRKGGINSGKTRRRKKSVKQIIEAIFESKAPDNLKQKLSKEFPGVEVKTIEELINLTMMRHTIKGNVQAYNALYDRKDGKPIAKTEIESKEVDKFSREIDEEEKERLKRSLLKNDN